MILNTGVNMNEMPLDDINEILINAGFSRISKIDDKLHFHQLRDLWEDGKEESENIEKLKLLLSKKVINESDVIGVFIGMIHSIDFSYDNSPLVKVLISFERDGTLSINPSDYIEDVCSDFYLEFIRSIVKLGGIIDHDALLKEVFILDNQEFEILNYLVDNFKFNPSSISVAISLLLIKSDDCIDENRRNKALQVLESKDFDINSVTEEVCDYFDYKAFLAVVLCNDPVRFKRYLNLNPTQETLDKFPWSFIIFEHEINVNHIQAIQGLNQKGYVLPLDEIADYLEELDLIDFAKEIRHT